MNSHVTRGFRELFSSPPSRVQRQARAAYRLFQADPAHPGLHFKQVNADPLIYSARVGISYRALCTRDGDTVIWFWIGSHAEYDRFLAQLEGRRPLVRSEPEDEGGDEVELGVIFERPNLIVSVGGSSPFPEALRFGPLGFGGRLL